MGKRKTLSLLLLTVLLVLSGCSSVTQPLPETSRSAASDDLNTSRFLRITNEEPDTADPQCTEKFYDIALNVFDRLVETRADENGTCYFAPSLADSWEISADGLVYTFHLHEGVTFSNGSPLTSSDVEYTILRGLTHPDSMLTDIFIFIDGAEAVMSGSTEKLAGFTRISDLDFSLTLSEPYAAFLAILSIPAASILDAETTRGAADRFGTDPEVTVGTGPFRFQKWNTGSDIVLTANPVCWSGRPECDGIIINFMVDAEAKRILFEEGKLDILDLENLGNEAEYFIRGDIYQEQLCHGRRIGLSYIALNNSVKPLDDVRVRKALQLSLDREKLLTGVYSNRGLLEQGIYPHGLIGFNPELPEIPYDPKTAAALLAEAGYPKGFDLDVCVDEESTAFDHEILKLASSMWEKIGIRAHIRVLKKAEFAERRRSGGLVCYASKYSVDYNDPDAIIYTFFGSPEDTRSRSICYPREDILRRVSDACSIVDEEERLREYRELERIIVQEDCAWIPLFSNEHYFIVNKRVRNFRVSWNGWTDTQYRDVTIHEETKGTEELSST